MSVPTFVDTNILVYAHSPAESRKGAAAKSILRDLWNAGSGPVSTQVLQELYIAVTRKAKPPAARSAARELIRQYAQWQVVNIQSNDVLAASQLEEEAMLSFWDALIVVAAAKAGADRLLSEDMNPGQVILGVRIENPFEALG